MSDLEQAKPTCGACDFMDRETGECYRNPPYVLYDPEHGAWSQRPTVEATDRACGEFKPCQ
jgi:hypothetical protein